MLPLSVGLLSAAALAYELLLVRLFSEVWWHGFATTVISLALLGYAASGTALALAQRLLLVRFSSAYRAGALGFAIAAPAAFVLAQGVSFNPLDLAWSPVQWVRFAGIFLVLAVPFLFAGGCLGLALRRFGPEIPGLYAADLAGAGVGAAGAVALLHRFPAEQCVVAVTLLACAAALCAGEQAGGHGRGRWGRWVTLGVFLAAALLPREWLTPRPSEFKGVSRQLLVPGARVVEERSGPRSRVQVVDPGTVPLRHAPGLSLGCVEPIPVQVGVFVDGEMIGAWVADPAPPPGYLDCLPLAAPYALLQLPRVAVLGAGGGAPVLAAVRGGATSVMAVEGDRQVQRLLGERLATPLGLSVAVRHADPRAFLAEGGPGFDLIQVDWTGSGGGPPGVRSTAPEMLATVEGVGAMLARLETGGLVAVTTAMELPPRTAVKWFATAVAALEQRGVEEPGRHLVWFRDWSTATLLVGRDPLEPGRMTTLREFCARRSYDLVYPPGGPAEADQVSHHGMGEPWLAQACAAILGPGRAAFLDRYPYFVAAATDDRPFFHRFFRWANLPLYWSARGRGGEGLLEWGYLLTPLALALAVVSGGALLLLPLAALFRRRRRGGRTVHPGPVGVYFGCLGVAFLLVEVVALQRAVLLLGHPVPAAAAVLAGFLVFAGAGSRLAPRLWERAPGGWPCWGVVAALALLQTIGFPAWVRAQTFALPVRVAVVLATTAPAALLMGMPFPLGLGRLAALAPRWVPWAWAVNGFGSVVSAALGALVAVHLGFAAALWLAVVLYGVAGWTAQGWGPGSVRASLGCGVQLREPRPHPPQDHQQFPHHQLQVLLAFAEILQGVAQMGERLADLFRLVHVGGVHAQDVRDLLQAEPEALAAQDQLEPGAVAPGEQTLVPFGAQRADQLLLLVEADAAGGGVELLGEFADAPGAFVGHGRVRPPWGHVDVSETVVGLPGGCQADPDHPVDGSYLGPFLDVKQDSAVSVLTRESVPTRFTLT
ncbi:MAG TPA: class I SAM-dependent methyltransferase [Deferrisomatales bacterium]|nr:class I SAM-dependent methyltransferase [Deferrisomatales bacterium]